jgi:glycosyltransferase involved in cell wall biosynthesis
MKIGIVIPTYWRKDGSSYEILTRALSSIASQTYPNYKVFLVGDKYEKDKELKQLSKIISPKKIDVINLPNAIEREKYSGHRLWCTGGIHASNIGISLCIKEKIYHVCHLDHDDWWEKNHLEEIAREFNSSNCTVVATKSLHINGQIFPRNSEPPFYPTCNDLVHSSVCINFKGIDLRYRNVYEETGKDFPADGDLWIRLSDYMKQNNLSGKLINKVTCNHLVEGHSKKI